VDPWPRRAPGRTPSAKPVQGSAHVPGAVTAPPRGGSVVAPGSPRARSDRLGMLPARGQRRDELGAADRRGPRDLVLPGRTGHLVGNDTALRDAVEHLLDPAVRARFGATARRSALRRTWSNAGDELVAHYTAVLAGTEQCAA